MSAAAPASSVDGTTASILQAPRTATIVLAESLSTSEIDGYTVYSFVNSEVMKVYSYVCVRPSQSARACARSLVVQVVPTHGARNRSYRQTVSSTNGASSRSPYLDASGEGEGEGEGGGGDDDDDRQMLPQVLMRVLTGIIRTRAIEELRDHIKTMHIPSTVWHTEYN